MGLKFYQEWIPKFNLELLRVLKILVWCFHKMLPLEYLLMGRTIIVHMGKILGEDPNNLCFCVNMDPKHGWVASTGILRTCWKEVEIDMEFEKCSMHYYFYRNLQHLLKDCQAC